MKKGNRDIRMMDWCKGERIDFQGSFPGEVSYWDKSASTPGDCVCGCGSAPAGSLCRLCWAATWRRPSSCWPLPDTTSTADNTSRKVLPPAESREDSGHLRHGRVFHQRPLVLEDSDPLVSNWLHWICSQVDNNTTPQERELLISTLLRWKCLQR